jgi:hypothetical protein
MAYNNEKEEKTKTTMRTGFDGNNGARIYSKR